jgi:hypothetical protein
MGLVHREECLRLAAVLPARLEQQVCRAGELGRASAWPGEAGSRRPLRSLLGLDCAVQLLAPFLQGVHGVVDGERFPGDSSIGDVAFSGAGL